MFFCFYGTFLRQITVCSQIVVLDQREETKQACVTGELPGRPQFCRDGYGWCWGSDCRGGNRVRRADPGPGSIGCSRAGRPVVYEPMLVPEDLVLLLLGILLFLSCFIFYTGTDGSHSGMGQSDVVHPLRFSRLGSAASPRGEVML